MLQESEIQAILFMIFSFLAITIGFSILFGRMLMRRKKRLREQEKG